MGGSIYQINKGVGKSIEFRGLKAQYIWWLGGGVLALMALFSMLYFLKVNTYICVGLVFALGFCLFVFVYRLSNRYGEHGLKKKIAKRNIPFIIWSHDRRPFLRQQVVIPFSLRPGRIK